MRRLARALAVVVALAAGQAAGSDLVAEARQMLAAAQTRLQAAETPAERSAALGAAVQAHERALTALRAGLRGLAAEDARLSAAFRGERERLVTLLSALQALSRAPDAAMLAYPGGPVRAARAARMMGAIAPDLNAGADALAARLDRLRAVRTSQEIARAQAVETLSGLQDLRADSMRRARRATPAPDRADLARQAEAAAARADDLAGLAAALRAGDVDAARPFSALRGTLMPPVSGRITGGFGSADPWGRAGQGVTFTAPAHAEVIAPVAGTVRYSGALIDYGTVIILEPAADWLIVLAGLDMSEREVGETVLAGDRLGDLGAPLPEGAEFMLDAEGRERQIRTSTLYVEMRGEGEPVDPAPWFALPGR